MVAWLRQRWQRQRGWLILALAGAVYAGALTGIATYRTWGIGQLDDYEEARAKSTSDFRDYWFTARHFREMGGVTTEFGVHNYLPAFPIIMLPWSYLPLPVAAGLFTLLSVGLFALVVLISELLLNQELGSSPRLAVLIACGLALLYVWSCAVLSAVDLLVLFLIILTWLLFEQRHEWAAGVPLGLAIVIKLIPGLLIVFFLLRRRWRVAGAAAAVALFVGLGFPLASIGWQRTIEQYDAFLQRAVVGHSSQATILAEQPAKAVYTNNALPIVLRRVLTPTDARPGEDIYVNIADWPRSTVLVIYVVLIVVIAGLTVQATLRGPARWPPEDTAEINRIRAQFAMWCAAMLLLSPLVWTRYLLLCYWPLAFLADRAERNRVRRGTAYWLAAAALLAWLAATALVAVPHARAAGAQLWAVLIAWAILVWFSTRPAAPPPPTPPRIAES